MLTRAGWGLAVGSALLIPAGRLLGIYELYVLAAIGLALAGCAVAVVWLRPARLGLERTISPRQVHAGTASVVDTVVGNEGRLPSPVVALHDAVSRTRGADILVGPLRRGETTAARYRLPTDRRGVVDIGPLVVTRHDPFGLAVRRRRLLGVTSVTVYPPVLDVPAPPRALGADPLSVAEHPNAMSRGGEDFYALRPFVVGDELKRVHWPSTARFDELMVRQQELPWQSRTTVLLDDRVAPYGPDGLDLAVSIAASLLLAAARRGDLVRLVTAGGADLPFGSGTAHQRGILEHLALLEPSPAADLTLVLERTTGTTHHGVTVAVTGLLTPPEEAAVRAIGGPHSTVWSVQIDPSAWDRDAGTPRPRSADRTVVVTGDVPFERIWPALVRHPSRLEARR